MRSFALFRVSAAEVKRNENDNERERRPKVSAILKSTMVAADVVSIREQMFYVCVDTHKSGLTRIKIALCSCASRDTNGCGVGGYCICGCTPNIY